MIAGRAHIAHTALLHSGQFRKWLECMKAPAEVASGQARYTITDVWKAADLMKRQGATKAIWQSMTAFVAHVSGFESSLT
jgi:hypothetical protein